MPQIRIARYVPERSLANAFSVAVAASAGTTRGLAGWPELKAQWPANTALILASGNANKVIENRTPLSFFNMGFATAKDFFGTTIPDSEEAEGHSIDIAHGKIRTSVLEPWSRLSASYRKAALATVDAPSAQHILLCAEDRSIILNPKIREHRIFDDVRASTDPILRQAFATDHDFPGNRMKELASAVGGTPAFVQMVEQAVRETPGVSNAYTLNISYYFTALEAGLLPLPKEGIVIDAAEAGFIFRPVTPIDLARALQGDEFDCNHFQVPPGYDHELTTSGKPVTSDWLRKNSPVYFQASSLQANVMRIFAGLGGVPRLNKPKIYTSVDIPTGRLIANDQIGIAPVRVEPGEKLGNHPRAEIITGIQSLADLERLSYHSEGTVIRTPAELQAPAGLDQKLFDMARLFEARLLFDHNAALMSAGGFHGRGRPLMVEQAFFDKHLSYYGDLANQGAISALRDDVFSLYADDDDLVGMLAAGRWKQRIFQSNLKPAPAFYMMDNRGLKDVTGLQDAGFCWAGLGSASSKIISGKSHATKFAALAARAGMVSLTGGGTREVMRCFFDGAADAYRAANGNLDPRFKKIGVRTPVVSRCEGDVEDLLRDYKIKPTRGTTADPHFTFLDDRMHILELEHMCERQHLVYAPAQAAVYFIGGIGTAYEFDTNVYHNLMVQARGHGIFPGFPGNDQVKPMFLVNSIVKNGRERPFFEKFLAQFTEQEKDMMSLRVFDTPEAAFEAMADYARSLGYDIPQPGQAPAQAPQPPILAMA